MAEKVEVEVDIADELNELEPEKQSWKHLHCKSVSLGLPAIVDEVNLLGKNSFILRINC